jgi:hypothetical protein
MNSVSQVILGLLLVAPSSIATRSPVQKVIELLEDNKVKISNDLAAEEKEMTEYADFCDTESSEKGYNIKTAIGKIENLNALVEENTLKIPGLEDEVSTLGTEVADKQSDLAEAKKVRDAERADFVAIEKDLATSIDQLGKAAEIISKASGGAFLQGGTAEGATSMALKAINKILDAGEISMATHKSLASLLQTGDYDEDEESIHQTHKKEGGSAAIVEKIEEMKEKAEEELTSARNAETKKAQDYDMLSMQLKMGIKVAEDKIGVAKKTIGAKTEELNTAKGELGETQKSKAQDEETLATLKHQCEEAAMAWEERQKSARAEMGAINKAIAILSEGVRVLLQVGAKTHRRSGGRLDEYDQDEDSDANPAQADANSPRPALVQKLKSLSHKFHSYAFMEMAGAASMDPLGKVKGLIEEMIEKLLKEAQEEATQKAFCDTEIGKSKKSLKVKNTAKDKLSARSDTAAAKKAELEENVKTLEKEIAGIDAANAEATKIRTEESATYKKASKDFGDAAEAVEKAIKVLKDFYEGASLLQVSAKTRTMSAAKLKEATDEDLDEDSDAPELGGAKSDAGSVIIGILEMSLEDFTKLLSETEMEEETAQEAYDKLTGENKISKATKAAEVKGALSQIKMLTTSLTETGQDLDSVNKELGAVTAYLEELKPQCEEKTMSYAEKKAKREAEIEGLKEALSILSGDSIALLQTSVTVSRH